MRIGFDFDNTIVSYDALFYKIALERQLIDNTLPINKNAVRDHLRALGQEEVWTTMQGVVYGQRMEEAAAYPDVIAIINKLADENHTLSIISHKTQYPYRGEQYDLHVAAIKWINRHLKNIIPKENIFFELTKEDKIERIKKFSCDVFVDDLPEILVSDRFPTAVKKLLFDPYACHSPMNTIKKFSAWNEFISLL